MSVRSLGACLDNDPNSSMHFDPLKQDAGSEFLCFRFGDREIRLTGSGCGNLFDGWRVEFVYSGFAPIFILQLVHAAGKRSVWYVSSQGLRLAGNVGELGQRHRHLLQRSAMPVINELVRSIIEDVRPALSEVARGFLNLDNGTKLEIMDLVGAHLFCAPEIEIVDATTDDTFFMGRGRSMPVVLEHRHITSALRSSLQDLLLASVRSGRATFSIPSPITGQAIEAQASLCFDDYHFAYRFVDSRCGLVFYLIAGYEVSQIYGLYIPQNDILFSLGSSVGLNVLIADHLPGWLSKHLCCFGLEYAGYLTGPMTGMTSVLRAPPWTHIGHQLWNELTGIDNLLKETESFKALEWVVPDGRGSVEFYGPVDDLFPQLRGSVKRGLHDAADVIRYAYFHRRFVVRITQEFISEDLRRRVLRHAASAATNSHDIKRLMHYRDGPVVLLGLRVENRTLVDLKGFYFLLIHAVLSLYPGARFVIDGHNAPNAGGREYRSHGENPANPPVTVCLEREILQFLTSAFGDVAILDAIGLTVPENLRLIETCNFFVAMWGAGLAKYRWICNKPGFVITSHWNLTQRPDLNIYDHPGLMEKPSPMYWLKPEMVTDCRDIACAMPNGDHPQWSNFTIAEQSTIDQIIHHLQMHTAEQPKRIELLEI